MKKISKTGFLLAVVDIIIIAAAFVTAKILCSNEFEEISTYFGTYSTDFLIMCFSFVAVYIASGSYNNIWIYANHYDYIKLVFSSAVASVLSFALLLIYNRVNNKSGVVRFGMRESVVALMFVNAGIIALRVAIRIFVISVVGSRDKNNTQKRKRLLIVGAGESTRMLVTDIYKNRTSMYKIVGLIDDDESKLNRYVSGVKVLGNRNDITDICSSQNIDEIIISIPSLVGEEKTKLIDVASMTGCKVKIVPGVVSSIESDKEFDKIAREVQIEDLLERDPIVLENDKIANELEDRVVLVSGGGGSIGSELCRQIASYNPRKLIILDIYENNAYDLQNELRMKYPYLKMEVLIASIRDFDRLDKVFDTFKPQTVFHAAAHKHVPLMEDSPGEAIKNNVFGTFNMAKCADKHGVEKFVMISTDKAVNPTNVMGATKRVCEMIVQSFQTISKTEFVAVRFGNVLGSNGSVIPLFKRQIAAGGPVTVTHKEVTRFFMTIPEAVQLVLQASTYAKGGEIFVLDMGQPVKIYDLADKLIRLSGYKPNVNMEIKVTGLRPGEKLYEELLMNEEGLGKTNHQKIFIGKPTFCNFNELEENLKILKEAVETKDDNAVVFALETVVPTYRESKKKNQVAKENIQ